MSTKLSQVIKFEPRKSDLDVPCALDPGHASKKYVRVQFSQDTITTFKGEQVPVKANYDVAICPPCFNTFAYEMVKVAREVETH